MSYRYLYLGVENFKRAFYKKTIIGVIVGLTFLLGYAVTLFLIEESDLETSFTANDFVLFFLNDFNISGIFLNMLFIFFIMGMFKDSINYMYISRLSKGGDFLKSWMVSMLISSVFFIILVLTLLFIVGGFLGEYSNSWSMGVSKLSEENLSLLMLMKFSDPVSSIIMSIWLYIIGLFIIFICFYLGFCKFKCISGGIFINIILLSVGEVAYYTKIIWLRELTPSINTIFSTHSLYSGGEYPSIKYSFIYLLVIGIVLYLFSLRVSKKYLEDSL